MREGSAAGRAWVLRKKRTAAGAASIGNCHSKYRPLRARVVCGQCLPLELACITTRAVDRHEPIPTDYVTLAEFVVCISAASCEVVVE